MKGVSVVICCYNSAAKLPETLRHLALQAIPENLQWELVIVNNNSSDQTAAIANSVWKQYAAPTTCTIVDEGTAGLSFARKKGVDIARYEYIIFCDDDNWLASDYISEAYQVLETRPTVGAVGGQSKAVTENGTVFPDWFEKHQGNYAVGKQSDVSGDITARKYLWGSGIAFRKRLFMEAYKKHGSLLTDRTGKELSSGGDAEFSMRIILLGYRLYYQEEMLFEHYIDPSRLQVAYNDQLTAGFDHAFKVLWLYKFFIDLKWMALPKKTVLISKAISRRIFLSFFKAKAKLDEFNTAAIYFGTGITVKGVTENMKVIKSIH
jgi:glycosyltransferase involved in cell wall biosynthesis